jgi:transcriptional regulator with XRE-family HTH domain
MGRRRIKLTNEHIERIERAAGLGLTLRQIAYLCDVSKSTLERWLEDENVRWHYDKGRAIAIEAKAQQLSAMADRGEVAALIFWLKAQAGWTDKPQPVPEERNNVHIYLPDNGRG